MAHTQPTQLDLLVAERIRVERARKRISLRALSEASGISAPTLSRIETGERSATMGQIAQIVTALGTSFETFMKGIDNV